MWLQRPNVCSTVVITGPAANAQGSLRVTNITSLQTQAITDGNITKVEFFIRKHLLGAWHYSFLTPLAGQIASAWKAPLWLPRQRWINGTGYCFSCHNSDQLVAKAKRCSNRKHHGPAAKRPVHSGWQTIQPSLQTQANTDGTLYQSGVLPTKTLVGNRRLTTPYSYAGQTAPLGSSSLTANANGW